MRLNSRIEKFQEKFSEKFYNKFVLLNFPYQRITDVRLGQQKAGHQEVKPANSPSEIVIYHLGKGHVPIIA